MTATVKTLVYSNSLRLLPHGGLNQVFAQFCKWIESKNPRQPIPEDFQASHGEYDFEDKSTLSICPVWESGDFPRNTAGIKASYQSLDDQKSGRAWLSEICISQRLNEDFVVCALNMFVVDSEPLPKNYVTTMPGLLQGVLDAFGSTCNSPGITPERLTILTAKPFLRYVKYRFRKCPVVVVSNTWSAGPVDSERLRKRLIGLAVVYQITSETDLQSLCGIIGRNYMCFDGAVKILWPMSAESHKYQSTLILDKSQNGGPRTPLEVEYMIANTIIRRHVMTVASSMSEALPRESEMKSATATFHSIKKS